MTWIARIFMALMGLAFLALLALALGLYIVFATLRWLLTGRKPQVVMVWQQFGSLRKQAQWGQRGSASPAAGSGEVVDVEAREVQASSPKLPGGRSSAP